MTHVYILMPHENPNFYLPAWPAGYRLFASNGVKIISRSYTSAGSAQVAMLNNLALLETKTHILNSPIFHVA